MPIKPRAGQFDTSSFYEVRDLSSIIACDETVSCTALRQGCLHQQHSLRFLVLFRPFDGCERVNQLRMFRLGFRLGAVHTIDCKIVSILFKD
jgi:hypothetical protein